LSDETKQPAQSDATSESATTDAAAGATSTDAEQPTGWQKLWREWIRPLGILLLIMWAFRTSVADWNDVPTGSMEPTIQPGDRIVVNKLAYGLKMPFTGWHLTSWSQPQRGDIVVFFADNDNGGSTRLVKRVVGLPGDRLVVRDNQLHINGEAVEYEWLDHTIRTEQDVLGLSHRFAIEKLGDREHNVMVISKGDTSKLVFRNSDKYSDEAIPEGHYFVMGDNRDHSKDSRAFGLIKREEISGRAFAVAVSLDYDAFLWSPRWERFFSGLQ